MSKAQQTMQRGERERERERRDHKIAFSPLRPAKRMREEERNKTFDVSASAILSSLFIFFYHFF